MNHTKWVLEKYPVNACGLRDDLSGDMFASSRRNFVPLVLVPPPPNQKLLPTPLIDYCEQVCLFVYLYYAHTQLTPHLRPWSYIGVQP